MKTLKEMYRKRSWRLFSFLFVAIFAVGGFFYPMLGLGVLALMFAALVMNFRRRRSFCAGVCPNGTFLAAALKPVTRNRKIPGIFVNPQFRRILCGIMLFCMIGLLARGYPDFASIGKVFWLIYTFALSAGILFGLFYKPRAWCAFCPLGTLQDTIGDTVGGATKKG